MKKIVMFSIMFGLAGCQDVESKTKDIALASLKDPDSAKFQNIKGVCGEVNAKNGFGGYSGFKRFYLDNNQPVFQDNDNSDEFKYGWLSHCEVESKLTDNQKTSCGALANYADSIVTHKNKLSKEMAVGLVRELPESNLYLYVINDVYSHKVQLKPDDYALTVLKKCLSGNLSAQD